MAVLEVGIIVDGLPVFKIDYHHEVKGDAALRSGLFAAIQSFAKEAFGDETEELRLKNLTICMKTISIDKKSLMEAVLYAVSDKNTRSIDSVRDALVKVGNLLINSNNNINTLQPDKNEFLREFFNKEFSDLRLQPAERARRLFG